jgi:hypothetical protein
MHMSPHDLRLCGAISDHIPPVQRFQILSLGMSHQPGVMVVMTRVRVGHGWLGLKYEPNTDSGPIVMIMRTRRIATCMSFA